MEMRSGLSLGMRIEKVMPDKLPLMKEIYIIEQRQDGTSQSYAGVETFSFARSK